MIIFFNELITLPLKVIFEESLKKGKVNVAPLYRKEDKMSSYCPISLISIFSKVFERVIYNSLFNHFLSNN